MKKKTLVIQSCAPNAPDWIRTCMRTVQSWTVKKDFDYRFVGDEIFNTVALRHWNFCKVTRSDIGRLRLIQRALRDYPSVYWLDSDFIIWNPWEFELPDPQPGTAVCAREALQQANGSTGLYFNNSVLGFCDRNDVEVLLEYCEAKLDHFTYTGKESNARMTIIGTDFFSSRGFPLRRIVAKSAGCFSAESIRILLGAYLSGRRHLFWLGLANGATLHGANLCSSRERDGVKMAMLVADLIGCEDGVVGRWRHMTPLYRLWLRIQGLPDRVRCWAISRGREIRIAVSGNT